MKKILIGLFSIFILSCSSTKFDEGFLTIGTTEKSDVTKDLSFKIEKIISDSRCPEGVQCVRAGEVKLTVGVYDSDSKTEEVNLVIDYRNFEQNKTFFESKIPLENKKIEAIQIFPNKIAGENIEEKEYELKLIFSDKK